MGTPKTKYPPTEFNIDFFQIIKNVNARNPDFWVTHKHKLHASKTQWVENYVMHFGKALCSSH
jgi:hypothetical protein